MIASPTLTVVEVLNCIPFDSAPFALTLLSSGMKDQEKSHLFRFQTTGRVMHDT